jgi:hypothetical protein
MKTIKHKIKKNKKLTKKTKKSTKNKKTVKTRKNNRNAKGKYDCCMCGKKFKSKMPFTPSVCGRKLGNKSHKICPKCWWDKFAVEGANHKCPGCPLETPKKSSHTLEVINLITSSSTH